MPLHLTSIEQLDFPSETHKHIFATSIVKAASDPKLRKMHIEEFHKAQGDDATVDFEALVESVRQFSISTLVNFKGAS